MFGRAPRLPSAIVILSGAIAWLGGCVSGPVPDQIQLRPAGGQHWSVVYDLARPTIAVTLVRTPNDARRDRWKFAKPDFEIVQINHRDVIRRVDGAAFSSVKVFVPATYIPLPKDYAPFSPFSDGGLLIHSGRFHACASHMRQSSDPCDGPWPMQITPPKGAHVIIKGHRHTRSLQWLDSGDGTKVYVGTTEPTESSDFIGIVDSALPAAITEPMADALPELMKYYADRLPPLKQRSTLFVSYDASFKAGHGSQGGTLPGQVFMHFYGSGWEDAELAGKTREDTMWFFAHEIGHLFQHGVVGVRDASWIHEGAAEAFAYIALGSLNFVTNGYVERRDKRAYANCGEALRHGTLASAADQARFADYYECGLVMFLAIDSEVRANSDGRKDVFDFWLTLIDTGQGDPWKSEHFLEQVHGVVGSNLADRLRLLVLGEQDEAAAALGELELRAHTRRSQTPP